MADRGRCVAGCNAHAGADVDRPEGHLEATGGEGAHGTDRKLPPAELRGSGPARFSARVVRRRHWESDATAAAELREQAMQLWAEAHQTRRDAMYARGRRP